MLKRTKQYNKAQELLRTPRIRAKTQENKYHSVKATNYGFYIQITKNCPKCYQKGYLRIWNSQFIVSHYIMIKGKRKWLPNCKLTTLTTILEKYDKKYNPQYKRQLKKK